jgi:hypothetical protein
VIVTANHPFGLLDGAILASVLAQPSHLGAFATGKFFVFSGGPTEVCTTF